MAQAERFLLDFGLRVAHRSSDGAEILIEGYGPDPFVYVARQAKGQTAKFGGAAYLVETREEPEKAAMIPGASAIVPLESPGGGEIVTLHDPAGHLVHLVFGQRAKAVEELDLEKLVVNYEDVKPRKGKFQRFEPGPAPVHKWGHYGVTYPDGQYRVIYDWYTKILALGVSDIVYRDEKPMTAFFHVDRGDEYTDHHAFFFKPTKPSLEPQVAHAAFEVHDFDTQQLGHNHLTSKGYHLCWGVGRHVLRSQIFDYWFDPSGFIMEHYADGDLVNQNTEVSHEPAGPQTLSIWGPPVPSVFKALNFISSNHSLRCSDLQSQLLSMFFSPDTHVDSQQIEKKGANRASPYAKTATARALLRHIKLLWNLKYRGEHGVKLLLPARRKRHTPPGNKVIWSHQDRSIIFDTAHLRPISICIKIVLSPFDRDYIHHQPFPA
ncbi:hypothetical protein LTR65_002415 [Meristemomyces frigidus]